MALNKKKKQFDYFQEMAQLAGYAQTAAEMLVALLTDYQEVASFAKKIHHIEHKADEALHRIKDELNRSFITPIDREDIVAIVNRMDDITDTIKKLAGLFDIFAIQEIRPEALAMGNYILEACRSVEAATIEFAKFKNSKDLKSLLIQVNTLEEEGDTLYREVLKKLYTTETDAIELIKWKEIYDAMEEVLNCCEGVSNLLDGLAIKNS